jgi:hypothetical protein
VSNTQSSSSSTSSPEAPRPAARPKLRQQRKKRVELMVLGIATALVMVAVAMPGRPPSPIEQTAPRQLLSQPPSDVEVTVRPTPPATNVPAAAASTTAAAPVTAPVTTPAKKTVAPKPRTVRPAEPPKAARVEAAVVRPVAARPAAAEPARSAPVTQEIAGPAPVTITGCLEMSVDEKEFRLTDTDGAGAPKSRSWKSGFLKKGSAPIELIDAADAHTLVGKRVAATGQLTSRTMRVNSLRVVTASCS